MATSAAPGFLTPIGPAIPYDDELLDILQPIVAGISGMDPTKVVPGWQYPDTPNMPDYSVNWIALRITRVRPDTFSYEAHVDDSDDGSAGYDVVESTEEFDLLVSCYGPNASRNTRTLRDGFQLSQNRWPLQQYKIDVLSVGEFAVLPALLTGQWQKRMDFTVTMRRYVSQQYGVLTVIGLPTTSGPDASPEPGFIDNEHYVTKLSPKA